MPWILRSAGFFTTRAMVDDALWCRNALESPAPRCAPPPPAPELYGTNTLLNNIRGHLFTRQAGFNSNFSSRIRILNRKKEIFTFQDEKADFSVSEAFLWRFRDTTPKSMVFPTRKRYSGNFGLGGCALNLATRNHACMDRRKV